MEYLFEYTICYFAADGPNRGDGPLGKGEGGCQGVHVGSVSCVLPTGMVDSEDFESGFQELESNLVQGM